MTTTNNADLAARMRDARKRAGLKQSQLTHIASRSQIGRIERGEVYAPETIDAWAAACRVSAEWLRTGVGPAAEAPAEPDRSGWPVLVRESSDLYLWPGGATAIVYVPFTAAWNAYAAGSDAPVEHLNPTEAADSLHARLPDEVSEAAQTVEPQRIDGIEALKRKLEDTAVGYLEGRLRVLKEAVWLAVPALHGDHDIGHLSNAIGIIATKAARFDKERDDALAPQPPPTNATGDVDWKARAEALDAEIADLRAKLDTALTDANEADDECAGWRARALAAEAWQYGIKDIALPAGEGHDRGVWETGQSWRRMLYDAGKTKPAPAPAPDLALVHRIVGRQTAALRFLATGEDPTFRAAVELAADTIEMVVGVGRG